MLEAIQHRGMPRRKHVAKSPCGFVLNPSADQGRWALHPRLTNSTSYPARRSSHSYAPHFHKLSARSIHLIYQSTDPSPQILPVECSPGPLILQPGDVVLFKFSICFVPRTSPTSSPIYSLSSFVSIIRPPPSYKPQDLRTILRSPFLNSPDTH